MPKLILVRHGLTDYNQARRYQGWVDIPLNEVGKAQARQLQTRLAGIKLDAAYCSDLTRTRQTAEIALLNHPSRLSAKPTSLLREISGGRFEGLTYQQMQEKFPTELKEWEAERYKVRAPEGENLQDVQVRLIEFLDIVQKEQPDEQSNILVVAHGGIVSSFMCHLLHTDFNKLWNWRVDTCSITVIDIYETGSILSLFNDISHITPGLPGEKI